MDPLELDPKKLQDPFGNFDLEKLKQDQADADSTRSYANIIGSIGQGLVDAPTKADILLKRSSAGPDLAGIGKAIASNTPDPVERQKKLMDAWTAQKAAGDEAALRDPTSTQSKISKANTSAAMESFKKSAKNNPALLQSYQSIQDLINDPGTSAKDIQNVLDKNPLLKEQFSADIASQKAEASAKIWGKRLDAEGYRTGVMNDAREDRIKNLVADKFDNDHQIQQLQIQSNAVDRGIHTLEGATTVTPQIFNEVQSDFASAINNGHAIAMGQQERLEYHSLEIEFANLKQRVTNQPQDINSPEVKQYLVDLGNRLKNAYASNIATRAKQIAGNRQYSTRGAQEILKGKLEQYAPEGAGENQKTPPQSSNQQTSDAENAAAIDWAKQQPPGNPKAQWILLHLSKKAASMNRPTGEKNG